MTYDQFISVVLAIASPFGGFRVGADGENGPYWLQFVLRAPDYAKNTSETEWRGRKWRVSAYSTEREVVGTALAAILMCLEHEARESFTYRGAAVFGPHIPLEALRAAATVRADRREGSDER